ncbi:MAG TPA: GAF domain-containing sensor histidine kinase, partial [Actinomycetota bacterium]|nr:GAF domain-containing sensor histidine kinase [Actinomycetota bacterium]
QIAQLFASQAGVAIENARLYAQVTERSESLARKLAQLSSVDLIGRLIITEEGVNRILRSVVEESMALTHSRSSILMLLDDDTGDLVARVARGALAAAVDLRIPNGTSKAHGVMERMRGEAVEDLSADPEVHDETWRKLLKPRRGAFAPLVVRGGSVGVLAVYDPSGGGSYSDDEVNVLQMLANQAAIALENERMTEALRVLAILEERERISKELHDGVIQAIYSVGLSLQGTAQIIGRDPIVAGERIESAIGELDEVVRDLRSYIFHLRPRSVEERGLESAIRELARDLEVNTIAHVEVQLDAGAGAGLPEVDQIHVIQIVREILSNIARHSGASEVEITMTADSDHILLRIDDDGVAFEPDRVVAGHGLRNVDERARALGGELQIVGRNPKGMRHAVDIPIRRGQ